MPAKARDFTGEKFGKLTVIKVSRTVRIGKNNIRFWLCRCECGKSTEVRQVALTRSVHPIKSCEACRRGNCILCGSPIPKEHYTYSANTCSKACRREWIKVRDRLKYLRNIQKDPGCYNVYYHNKVQCDPDFLKNRAQQNRNRYASLPEAEKQQRRMKERQRARKRRKNLKADPEKYSEFLAKKRKKAREDLVEIALAELQTVGKTLMDKSNEG